MKSLKYSSLFLLLFIVFSCDEKQEKAAVSEPDEQKVAALSVEKDYVFINEISAEVREEIKAWKELKNLSQFLQNNFEHISPSMSLELSKELVDMSKALKDSLNIPTLNNRPFLARINVFYSEALRLNDMSNINAIKVAEVEEQVQKIATVYNSINKKIEDIYAQKNFDRNVNFDESVFEFARVKTSDDSPEKPKSVNTNRPSVLMKNQNEKSPFRK